MTTLYSASRETNVTPGEEENVRRTMALYYDLARPFLVERDRVLDVGCDRGFLLEAARADGFTEVCGVEPNPEAARFARSIPGAVVACSPYEEVAFDEASFDLVTLIHVVDHLADPLAVLTRARSQMRPQGVIVAVVHNIESILARLLGERFPPLNLYHYHFFSKRTLRSLFERAGFEVLRTVSSRNVYSVGFLANRIPALPPTLKRGFVTGLRKVHLARLPVRLRLGNVALVGRNP